jgi:hypothetical protein
MRHVFMVTRAGLARILRVDGSAAASVFVEISAVDAQDSELEAAAATLCAVLSGKLVAPPLLPEVDEGRWSTADFVTGPAIWVYPTCGIPTARIYADLTAADYRQIAAKALAMAAEAEAK